MAGTQLNSQRTCVYSTKEQLSEWGEKMADSISICSRCVETESGETDMEKKNNAQKQLVRFHFLKG